MRNLKKILAMVLALVMSLSLMATAGAADFKDQADISEKYQTAVEVLRNLEVFNGYAEDNTFRPENSITREEVAAIIYRIATGDVKGASAGIYADYNIFKDVTPDRWSAGYINFCANAEYIKGHGNGNFDPKGNVTGYEALAMILRAIGYTANGGFSGPEWHLQTGRVAEARGITKNVQMGTLGEPASRQTVAELLFQSILVNMVNYDQRTGYYELEQSLGYKVFQLEELEGVVVANEFANLYGTSVLADGKTNLEVAKDDIRTLDIATEITAIGERYALYTQNVKKVLTFTNEGLNTVKETGAATDISSAGKFQSTADMRLSTTGENITQFYVNFDRAGLYTCDQRLEFSVTFAEANAMISFDRYANVDISAVAARDNLDNTGDNNWTVNTKTLGDWATNETTETPVGNLVASSGDYVFVDADYPVTFKKVIRANNDISNEDLNVIYGIFGAADNFLNNSSSSVWAKDQITGDVFVGTVSSNPTTREEQDLSNNISYNQFFETYINSKTSDINWNTSVNGDWVKFIDNNNDGVCDYAFRTTSWLDEAMGTFKKGDNTITEYNRFNEDNSTVRYMDGNTPAVGDVVVCSLIDGQILVEPAKNETVTVSNYNWRDDKITTDKGEYGQSGIGNATEMPQLISTMDDRTEYVVYFDHFGFVRAYELPGETKYALVTEMYAANNFNGNVVNNSSLTVELTMPNEAGNTESKEYGLINTDTPLRARTAWTMVQSTVGAYQYYNYLQPAIAHLGVTRNDFAPTKGAPAFNNSTRVWQFWSAWRQIARVVSAADAAGLEEFNYGRYDRSKVLADQITANTYSFTNVAIANINGDNVSLNGAAQLRLDSNGQPTYFDVNNNGIFGDTGDLPRYSVDYVQLATGDVAAKQVNYPVHDKYSYWDNGVVNATHNTEFYIVHNNGVHYFKDYVNMPELNGDNYIYAAYAVARDTSGDRANRPYWVADVIVYEVRTWDNDATTSVALAYFNQSRTSGSVQLLNTLSNVEGGPMVDVVPGGLSWNAQGGSFDDYSGYGFYHVWNGSAVENGQMSARRVSRIQNSVPSDGNYGKAGIYAGYVDRVTEDAVSGGYIYVNTTINGANRSIALAVNNNVFEVQEDTQLGGGNYNVANSLRYSNLSTNQIRPGDLIIWQGGTRNTSTVCDAAFIVDLGVPSVNPTSESELRYRDTPIFLKGTEWTAITAEQGTTPSSDYIDITFNFTSNTSGFPGKGSVTEKVAKGTAATYYSNQEIFKLGGWTVTNMSAVDAAGNPVGTWTASTPGNLVFTNVQTTGNITVTVEYTKVVNSVNVTLSGFSGGEAVSFSAPTATLPNGTVTSGTPFGVGMDWESGATVTWTGLPNTTYDLSLGSNATFRLSNVGNAYTLTCEKVQGAASVTVTAAAMTPTTITGAATTGITWGTVNPTAAYEGDTFEIAVTVNAGYEVTGMYWTDDGVTKHQMTEKPSVPGTWVSSDAVGSAPVTVYAEVVSTTAVVSLGNMVGTVTVTADYTDVNGDVLTGQAFTADAGGTPGTPITVKKGTAVTLHFTAPATPYVTGALNGKPVTLSITGNGTNTVYVNGINEDVTLAVFGSQADLDQWVATNS